MRKLLLTAFTVCATGASAAEPDCKDPVTQSDMNLCAALDYEAADKELNAVWKLAHQQARDMDADETEAAMKGAEKALLAAQRGWLAYRDGRCTLEGWAAHGGSMEPMLVSGCLAEMTRTRTKELRDFANGSEQ